MVEMRSSGSLRGARETKRTPSAKASRSSMATSSARRVLPTPPVPVRVTKRTSTRLRRAHTAVISCSLPTSGAGGTGSVCVEGCSGFKECFNDISFSHETNSNQKIHLTHQNVIQKQESNLKLVGIIEYRQDNSQ